MILRKPFALLIKHFRFIHIVLSICISYLVLKTSHILTFISEYLSLPTDLVTPNETDSLFSVWLYIVSAILIVGYIIIMVLMKWKEKPITFYVISIFSLLFSLFSYIYTHSVTVGLQISLTDIRTLKLYQDLIRTTQILQFIIAVVTIIRATGFNIKKFNFTKDIEQLQVEEEDREEFEIKLEVDEGSFKRRWKHLKRNTKYVLKENKMMILFSVFVLILSLIGSMYLNKYVFYKIYQTGELVDASDYAFTFQKGYKIKSVSENEESKAYLMIPFDVYKQYGKEESLETLRLTLQIEGHTFYHNKDLAPLFFDLGKVYQNEKIGTTSENYSLIFEIPETFIKKEMYIVYEEIEEKDKTVKVDADLLKAPSTGENYQIKDTISFGESTLKNSTFMIENYTINDFYQNTYTFCALENMCYESVEYIIPTFTDNDAKAILKLEAEFVLDKDLTVEGIQSMSQFLNAFGSLQYQISGETKKMANWKTIVPKSTNYPNTYYIEVKKELKDAEKIWIEFIVRDKKYNYYLK